MTLEKNSILIVILLYLILLPDLSYAEDASTRYISGQVLDARTGDPLPGVTLVIKGTTNGTVTDLDGNYELSGFTDESQRIVVSFIGYKTQEKVVVEGDYPTSYNFYLKEDYSQSGNIYKAFFKSIVWLSIALIFLGIISQYSFNPLFTITIPKISLPLSLVIYGLVDIFDYRLQFNLRDILSILIGISFLAFFINAIIRKRVNKIVLIIAVLLILESLVILIYNIIYGHFRIYIFSPLLTNLIIAGGVLAYAEIYTKIMPGISISQRT